MWGRVARRRDGVTARKGERQTGINVKEGKRASISRKLVGRTALRKTFNEMTTWGKKTDCCSKALEK